jgi:hypothetical protein
LLAFEKSRLSAAYERFISVFAEAVAKTYGIDANGVRFVVFIDDLDRCLPDVAIAVIEAIKNHLSVDRCIYILGLNPQVIERGIRHKYGSIDMSGREYLEKILNYSFTVPAAAPSCIEAYGSMQLARLLVDDNAIGSYSAALAQFGSALKACSFSNPRKIKRILNSYLFFIAAQQDSLGLYYLENIARLLILAEYYPSLFAAARADNGAFPLLREVLNGQRQPQMFLERFGQPLEPILSELKLMPNLMNFVETVGGGRLDLNRHLAAVANLLHQP